MRLRQFILILLFSLLAIPVWAANCISTANSFNESPGNITSGDPCWAGGASSCQQTACINLTAGACGTTTTGLSIATAPSGFTCPDVLELTHGSGAELDYFGTIPYIASGTNYTFSFEYEYTSETRSAYSSEVVLTYPGAGTPAQSFGFGSSGSNQFYVNNGSTAVSGGLTINTHYNLEFSVSGTSCSFLVNGTSEATWTCAAYDAMEIRLIADGGSANQYFGEMQINASSLPACLNSPNAFADFAGGTSGTTVTASLLNGGTIGGGGGANFGGWSYTAGGSTDLVEFDTANAQNLAGPITVCGSSYSGNTGVSIHHDVPAASTPGAYAGLSMVSPYSTLVTGFYWKVNTTPASLSFTDMGRVAPDGPIWHVCGSSTSTCASGGTNLLFVPEESGGTELSSTTISNNTQYWITIACTSSGADSLNIYPYGSNTALATYSLTDTGCPIGDGNGLLLGAAGTESPGVQLDEYVSNVVVCLRDCSFPMLQPLSSSIPNQFPRVAWVP